MLAIAIKLLRLKIKFSKLKCKIKCLLKLGLIY